MWCIIIITTNEIKSKHLTQKLPRAATLGSFLLGFVGLLPVNPLANIVTDYTAITERTNEIKIVKTLTSFLTEEADNNYYITHEILCQRKCNTVIIRHWRIFCISSSAVKNLILLF